MKRYFIWKDGVYNGEDTVWERISGKQYYALVNSPEGEGRYFAHTKECEDDRVYEYYFEVTRENYLKWKRENMAEIRNLQEKYEHPLEFVSLDTILYYDDDGMPVTLADTIPEPEPDPMIETLYEVIDKLLPEEREMITRYYLDNPQKKSQRVIAEEMGMPQQTFSYRLKKILEKMKGLFGEN